MNWKLALIPALVLLGQANVGHSEDGQWAEIKQQLEQPATMKVYRSPTCGCCSKWIEHVAKHGFEVEDQVIQDMSVIKAELGVPGHLASCHTAVVNGYVVEGHVPADDIIKMLNEQPDIQGLTVPAMPVGTPGMEMGDRKDPFNVMSFRKTGESGVFTRYTSY